MKQWLKRVTGIEAEEKRLADEAAALEAKKRAEEAMLKRDSDVDYSMAAAELARAAAQIRAIQKLRKKTHS